MRMTIAAVIALSVGLFVTTSLGHRPKVSGRFVKPKKIGISLITLGLYLAAINQAKADLIYWADQNTGGISRANLDGSQQQTLVTGQSSPTGIALDVGAGQMYWTNQSSNGAILRANLDGTGQQTLLVGQVIPFGIALLTLLKIKCTGPKRRNR